MKIFNRKRKEVEIPPVVWPPPSLKKLLAYNRKVTAEKRRHEIKTQILPEVKKALANGSYDFTSKNSVRIFVAQRIKVEPNDELEIRIIEVSWT